MELERSVGLRPDGTVWLPDRRAAVSSILLKLAAMGARIPADAGDEEVLHLTGDLFARYREQTRLLSEHLCPADRRIQHYIDSLIQAADLDESVALPSETLILDRYGLARELSLPLGARFVGERAGLELPARQRRAAQPGERPAHHPGGVSRRGGRAADSRRQDAGSPRRVRAAPA